MFINTSGSSPYNNLNSSLKQIHYRHRKQGEKEDYDGTEGDDYPLGHLNDRGEGGVGSLHIALGKIQGA